MRRNARRDSSVGLHDDSFVALPGRCELGIWLTAAKNYKIYVYDKQFVLGVYCFVWQRVFWHWYGPIVLVSLVFVHDTDTHEL